MVNKRPYIAGCFSVLWRGCVVVLLLYLTVQLALTFSSWRRPVLGLVKNAARDVRLEPCPETPNCVCSEAEQAGDAEHAIEPFPTSDDPEADFARLKELCTARFGFVLIEEQQNYLRFECITPLARYVDDLEFRLEESADVIHVRSASRVGQGDFGVNRERTERVRSRFAKGE